MTSHTVTPMTFKFVCSPRPEARTWLTSAAGARGGNKNDFLLTATEIRFRRELAAVFGRVRGSHCQLRWQPDQMGAGGCEATRRDVLFQSRHRLGTLQAAVALQFRLGEWHPAHASQGGIA